MPLTLSISFAEDALTYYPIFSPNYSMNLSVYNNATTERSGTVSYWLKNSGNGTVWQKTYSFLISANSMKTLRLYYPVESDGNYTAYAQVVDPNQGLVLSNTFVAKSGIGPLVPWVILAVILVIGIAYLASRKAKKKRKQKMGKLNEPWPAKKPEGWPRGLD